TDFEKLGVFYLGRETDPAGKTDGAPVLYDSRHLLTHAVCVGMTGSGKTGLCLSLLEEAAIDGIPAICIDPKGDLGNLMLTFPQLRPEDFRPWVDPAEATRRGMTTDEFVTNTATSWKQGLMEWGQTPERIQRFRDAADVSIYTPGNPAGLQVTVLRSFTAPDETTRNDAAAMRDRISSAVSGLLALLSIDADPLKSREHILLSNLLDARWKEGLDLDLGSMIRGIQSPPFDRLGVLDLESFFPAKERFEFAMQMNNLLASPGFAAWREGEALDVQKLLYTPEGKPRIAILSIAHLSDPERMFFVTILLNEVLAWMRRQPGTSSLRAILYMDEVFGFFPPTANPPSKIPMLTLLKQARAYGLGVMLATQNPVDLDYKGLSNCGTWFIGRLQTERDKGRLLDGLEGASAASGAQFDRAEIERTIASLGNRVFLMHNVHDDAPVVFQTRWALSYLRGPMTTTHIEQLMAAKKSAQPATSSTAAMPSSSGPSEETDTHPVLPPEISECFLPCRTTPPRGAKLVYRAGLLGSARVHFENRTADINEAHDLQLLVPAIEELSATVWDAGQTAEEPPETESSPESGARFASLSPTLSRPKTFADISGSLKEHLYRTQRLRLLKCKELKEISKANEEEGVFRVRLSQLLKEQRDLQIEKLRAKYAPKLATVQEKIRKAEQKLEKEKAQASSSTVSAAIQFGTSVLGAMFGRKLASTTNLTRAATSARSAGRALEQRQDVGQANENIETLKQQLIDLNEAFETETAKLQDGTAADGLVFDEVLIKPKKTDITVTKVVLAWTPWIVTAAGDSTPAWE
ncbi:MAG TPA: ATP-binding protein, partial [Planctomycetaceae bacterium]|nr:ATP-binding protein [Planctomycetaceae bacterium]